MEWWQFFLVGLASSLIGLTTWSLTKRFLRHANRLKAERDAGRAAAKRLGL